MHTLRDGSELQINWEVKRAEWDLKPSFLERETFRHVTSKALQVIGFVGVVVAGALVSGHFGTFAVTGVIAAAAVFSITLIAGFALGMKREFWQDPDFRQKIGKELIADMVKTKLQSEDAGFNALWASNKEKLEQIGIGQDFAQWVIEDQINKYPANKYGEFFLANSDIWESGLLNDKIRKSLKTYYYTRCQPLCVNLAAHLNELKHLTFTREEYVQMGIPANGKAETYGLFRNMGGLELWKQYSDLPYKESIQSAASKWMIKQGIGKNVATLWKEYGEEANLLGLERAEINTAILTNITIDIIHNNKDFSTISPYRGSYLGQHADGVRNAFFKMDPRVWGNPCYLEDRKWLEIDAGMMLQKLSSIENVDVAEVLGGWLKTDVVKEYHLRSFIDAKTPETGLADLKNSVALAAFSLFKEEKNKQYFQVKVTGEISNFISSHNQGSPAQRVSAVELEKRFGGIAALTGADLNRSCATVCGTDVGHCVQENFDYGTLLNRTGKFLTDKQQQRLRQRFIDYVAKMKMTYNSISKNYAKEIELHVLTAEEWEKMLKPQLALLVSGTSEDFQKYNAGNSGAYEFLTQAKQNRINDLSVNRSPV